LIFNSENILRLTIGGIQISEGRRLVGFEIEARRGTISGIQISEGLRLVGFEFEARRGAIGGTLVVYGESSVDI
jgi:hypothetical protein